MFAYGGDSVVANFELLQTSWRDFRKAHCTVIWDQYEDCGGCNLRAAHYLQCLKEITDLRIADFKKLLLFYRREESF